MKVLLLTQTSSLQGGAQIGTCVPSINPKTRGNPIDSKNFGWSCNCFISFGKTMYSFPKKESASVTVLMHRETDGWDIPCEVATTVWKESVAKNCSATANWVVGVIECDLIVDRLFVAKKSGKIQDQEE